MKEKDLLLLLREIVMRANLMFPETEQDLKWFDEGIKNQPQLFDKVANVLDLGNIDNQNYEKAN